MKLIDALSHTGRPFEIPECRREELPELFVHLGFTVGAEIGVLRGEFTKLFCEAGLKMYAIDPWMAYKGAGRTEQSQEKQELNYRQATELLAPYDCEILRCSSMEAVERFRNRSLDFVYIDGDHSFLQIAKDIYEWTRRVRGGGIIAGHDYYCSSPEATNMIVHVKPVVDAFTSAYNINFYTFDAPHYTWMFRR